MQIGCSILQTATMAPESVRTARVCHEKSGQSIRFQEDAKDLDSPSGAGFGRIPQFKSPREQAPGPRGSPQEPHGPEEAAEAEDELLAETANTDSCGSSLVAWHLGQAAFSLP